MGNQLSLWMALWFLLALELPVSGQSTAGTDYLLLKNGAVLSGRIIRDGDTYVVRSSQGTGESRYPAALAVKLCASASEVYAILKKHAVPDEATEHCRLAKFCIAHNLFKEADAEIAAALQCDRRSAEAVLLRTQLINKQKQPVDKQEPVPTLPVQAILPQAASLDDWPMALQPEMFQDFSRRVQPLLLVGCGTGACHGVPDGKRSFVLKKGLQGVQPSVIMSRTNLERTLSLVDANKPETSELLKRALQPHGQHKIWPVSQEQHAALRQWVHAIAGKPLEVARQQSEDRSKKGSVGFASQADVGAEAPPAKITDTTAAENSARLPGIPGISGNALQQMGGTAPSQEKPIPVEAGKATGGLPAIPGVSGKGQGSNTPPRPVQSGGNTIPPKAQLKPQDTPAYWEYARRLGFSPGVASMNGPLPDRLHIENAGTYSLSAPPIPRLSEELSEKLKREEEARNQPKDKTENATPPAFMRSGTVVSGPK